MKIFRRVLLCVSIASFVGGRPAAAHSDRVRERDTEWTAPAKNDGRVNPFRSQPALSAGGRKIFSQRCTSCHGDDGRGTTRAPNLVAADVQRQTDGALVWKITTGETRAGMPSFSFLPEAQRWQLVLHLRNLAVEARSESPRPAGLEPAPPLEALGSIQLSYGRPARFVTNECQ